MKSFKYILLLLITGLLLGYSPDDYYYNPSNYRAIIMKRSELDKGIFADSPRNIVNTGKIYYKDSLIFLGERFKGFHVIDNHDPSNPVNVGFISIPGSIDISIKGTYLYTDNATDLISIDISEFPNSVAITKRIEKIFPEPTPPDLNFIPYIFSKDKRPRNTVIVNWVKEDNRENSDFNE
ncbi:hypothetical protein ACFLSA_00110 [Bacteroidota bacterium]